MLCSWTTHLWFLKTNSLVLQANIWWLATSDSTLVRLFDCRTSHEKSISLKLPVYVPSRERSHIPSKVAFEDDFSFSKVGYVSFFGTVYILKVYETNSTISTSLSLWLVPVPRQSWVKLFQVESPFHPPNKSIEIPKWKHPSSGHAIDLNRPNLKRSKQQMPPQVIPDDFKGQVDLWFFTWSLGC